jgi:hypothetical protein
MSTRIGRRSTLEATDRLVDGGPPLEYWLVELASELCVLTAGSPASGPRAVGFCEETIAQLQLATGDAWMYDRFMVALGDILFPLYVENELRRSMSRVPRRRWALRA